MLILAATAIGGGAGYVLQAFAGPTLDTKLYAPFSVFWSALYLFVSALSGLQQEVTRATKPVTVGVSAPASVSHGRGALLRNFSLLTMLVVAALVAGSAWLWVSTVFPVGGWSFIPPLVLGLVGYVAVAAISGVFYGLSFWVLAAMMTVVDGLLRLVIVGTLLFLTKDTVVLAWGVAAPFALTPVIVWLVARSSVTGRFSLDVGPRALTWNVARTIVAATATGIMVSGLPLVIQSTGATGTVDDFGALTYAINLTRAPIVIVVLALQSYLVVTFRAHADAVLGWVLRLSAVVLGGSLVLAFLAWWLGPWVLTALFHREDVLPALTLGLLVATAGLVGVLCVTGAATLARSQHSSFTAGWIVAAILTIIVLLLPLGLQERTLLAMTLGPVGGLVVHGIALTRRSGRGAGGSVPEPIS
ncbi:hypothetical protein ACL9RL_02205 [Plantibacter sp. Mn2098]|uniref:hypothetical protein n=1 Tax=Plantibacter sp. Mn2098 TaxID=3395266 RepID=UPI003BEDF2BF